MGRADSLGDFATTTLSCLRLVVVVALSAALTIEAQCVLTVTSPLIKTHIVVVISTTIQVRVLIMSMRSGKLTSEELIRRVAHRSTTAWEVSI